MYKILIASAFLILNVGGLLCQDLKKVNEKLRSSNSIATYHVLKSDKQTKHGDYTLVNGDGLVIAKGTFDQDMKVGPWEYCRVTTETVIKYTFDHDKDTLTYFATAERINELGYTLKQFDFEESEPPAESLSLEDNVINFHEDFSNAFISEYGKPNASSHRGVIYIGMICTEQQQIINPEILSRLGDYDRNHLLKVANRTLDKFENKRILFIDLKGNPTDGEVIIPLVFL